MLTFNITLPSPRSILMLVFLAINFGTLVRPQGNTCDTSMKGFATLGSGTTGGGNTDPVTVSTMEDLRKACLGSLPAVIRVSGTIQTGPKPIIIGSNKTLIGLNGATIHGGIQIKFGTKNVIIRYLTIIGAGFKNLPSDTISGYGTSNVWIDHCELSDAGGGLLDMTKGSDLITVSWTKFSYKEHRDYRVASLIGATSTEGNFDRGKLRVTFHNNYFATNVTEGMARVRFGQVHFVNNLYSSPDNNYVIGVGIEASVLVENNVFDRMNDPITAREANASAYVTESGNIFRDTFGHRVSGSIGGMGKPFNKPPYAFNAIPAADVEKVVRACARAKPSSY